MGFDEIVVWGDEGLSREMALPAEIKRPAGFRR